MFPVFAENTFLIAIKITPKIYLSKSNELDFI